MADGRSTTLCVTIEPVADWRGRMNWTVASVNTIPSSTVITVREHISIGAKWSVASRGALELLDAGGSRFRDADEGRRLALAARRYYRLLKRPHVSAGGRRRSRHCARHSRPVWFRHDGPPRSTPCTHCVPSDARNVGNHASCGRRFRRRPRVEALVDRAADQELYFRRTGCTHPSVKIPGDGRKLRYST